MDREHLVPLSRQAVEVVQRRLALCGRSGLLFEAPTVSKVISENTMLFAIYRMGYHSRATTHGLRGTFSTIANESEDPSWEPDWIEMALAHKIPGVRGAEGMVGPPLTMFAHRAYIAGRLSNQPENLVRWIQNPQDVDPETAMPDLGVIPGVARDMAAYLYTLR